MKTAKRARLAADAALYDHYVYFDTDKHLADFLFAREKVTVEPEEERSGENGFCRIIRCRVPRVQREAFRRAMDALPDWMAYVGRRDYDAYCLSVLMDAVESSAGRIPA